MREDLAEWMNTLYPELRINVDNFMDRLDTGVALCKVSGSLLILLIDRNQVDRWMDGAKALITVKWVLICECIMQAR